MRLLFAPLLLAAPPGSAPASSEGPQSHFFQDHPYLPVQLLLGLILLLLLFQRVRRSKSQPD
jgi:hypothetical protein